MTAYGAENEDKMSTYSGDWYSDHVDELAARMNHLGEKSADASQALADFGNRYQEVLRQAESDELQELEDIDVVRLALLEEGATEPDFRYNDEIGRRAEERSGISEGKSRWVPQVSRTPSGKLLFRCRECFRFSTTPDKRCREGCGE